MAPVAAPAVAPSPTATSRPVASVPATPPPSSVASVVVGPGDTLWGIAQRYGLAVDDLLAVNPQVTDPALIHVGDRIAIPGGPFAGPVVAIVDGLGEATTETTFGAPWGHDISDQQQGGPLFILEGPTRISEIGAFIYGAPLKIELCRAVRESDELLPDRSNVLATFALPVSAAPGTATYAAVDPGLVLPAGSYYAVFAPLAGGVGSLLGGAFSPVEYRAGSLMVWLSSGARPTTQYAAVRILGRSLARPEPTPTEVPAASHGPTALGTLPGAPGPWLHVVAAGETLWEPAELTVHIVALTLNDAGRITGFVTPDTEQGRTRPWSGIQSAPAGPEQATGAPVYASQLRLRRGPDHGPPAGSGGYERVRLGRGPSPRRAP